MTGNTALFSDISVLLSERIWLVVGFVILLSVVLLAAMFRSVVVQVKAAVLNLLSIEAEVSSAPWAPAEDERSLSGPTTSGRRP